MDRKHTVEVHVEKGMQHMQKIMFHGEGNQNSKGQKGDVIVLLIQREHPVFERRGDDLVIRKVEISLAQALCGIEYVFKHLDDRDIVVRNKKGEVIKSGDVKGIVGEGMPIHKNPFEKGNLYIEFVVQFPTNNFASKEQMQKLESLLPARTPFVMPIGEQVEEVDMIDLEPRSSSDSYGGGSSGNYYDADYDDDSHHGHGPSVQCQTQ